MAEELNNYVASVFTVEDTSNIQTIQESQGAGISVVAITNARTTERSKSG